MAFGEIEQSRHAPGRMDDLDRVIDLYFYEDVPGGNPNLHVGGKGAFCYYGPAECARLEGTELEAWVDRLKEHISNVTQSGEDFRVEFEGRYWRACRDSSDQGTQVSIRRLPNDCPHLDDLRIGQDAVRDLLKASWLNDGGLVMFCGLTGQGKTTVAAATTRARLERFGGRCCTVEDVSELPLEGLIGKGSCRQLRVDYQAADPARRGFPWTVRRAYRSQPATRPAILFIGEVRDTETAVEVVKAAANGMLVITTVHSFDPATALMRIASLAEAQMGEAAGLMLSQALRIAVHLTLDLRPDTVGWSRGTFNPTVLVSSGPSHPLAHMIRKGTYSHMTQIQDAQRIKIERASSRGGDVDELITALSNPA